MACLGIIRVSSCRNLFVITWCTSDIHLFQGGEEKGEKEALKKVSLVQQKNPLPSGGYRTLEWLELQGTRGVYTVETLGLCKLAEAAEV